MAKQWALITGATVGIGDCFARHLASQGYNLVINARSKDKLEERADFLRKSYNVEVIVLAADLATDCEIVEKYLQSNEIEVLINNAGFGLNQSFLSSSIEDEERVLDVLVRAPMRLMHAVLPQMSKRDSGIVLNVSSTAAFIAGGHYSAAKAYVTVMSESLHTQMLPTNVKVTSLNPGFVRTEFHQRAGMKMGAIPDFMWLDGDFLVKKAWSDALKGKAISIPGWQYKLLRLIIAIAPRPYVRKMGMSLRTKQR
ncbi:DltE Short-chain dehydrogenases of various substrate specificities [Candidatus Nanopelagicaceae bacterium]